MEQATLLADRIKELKAIASSVQEGAIHTRLFPEIDSILALPDDLRAASMAEREAVTRQVREYEQTFNQIGYSLLKQLIPTTTVSPIFQVVQAAEEFRRGLRDKVGQSYTTPEGESATFDHHAAEVLSRYSLSIGTPPVTARMRGLIARILLGKSLPELFALVDVIGTDPTGFEQLLRLFEEIISSSLHYCTGAEEQSFLAEAAEFAGFEGGRIFNRVVITESPERVIALIQRHVFDKFGPDAAPPVQIVDGVDRIDDALVAAMQARPNQVFVVRVTRLPHLLFRPDNSDRDWRSVIGRLVLVDCSERARKANTTLVYTLFPQVARTLRNVQTSFAGKPANTQLVLRRILERFSAPVLANLRAGVDRHLQFLESQGVLEATVAQTRAEEWRRHDLLDYLTLVKLRRLIAFIETIAGSDPTGRHELGASLRREVASSWMRYFYRELPTDRYPAIVVTGAGRGALTLIGEFHRQETRAAVAEFCDTHLGRCRDRLAELKQGMDIPTASTDEIQAAIKQSQIRALSPTQWRATEERASLPDHLARTALYRLAERSSRIAKRARDSIDKAAFSNLTGGAAAYLKKTLSQAGFGALHGRLEGLVGERVGRADRLARDTLAPIQGAVRAVQRSIDDIKGGLDPVAVNEIEATLKLVEQGHFYPTLILPAMAWSYRDVFPDKYFPEANTIRVRLNDHHELDPMALLGRLEELSYLYRRFPELFALMCRSMVLVINSPHNPTGVVYRRETVLHLLKIASEYGITVVDDNAYHKLVFSWQKAREGEGSVAEIYERYRHSFSHPVRILTATGTTKGLQGAGDRTGLILSNLPEVVEFAAAHSSEPHLLSLYMTRAKLENGRAAKHCVAALQDSATRLLAPGGTASPGDELRAILEEMLTAADDDGFPTAVFENLLDGYEELLRLHQRGARRRDLSTALSDIVARLKKLRLERALRHDVEQRVRQVDQALERVLPGVAHIPPQGAFYYCVRLCDGGDDRGIQEFLCALSRHRKVDVTYAGSGYVRLSLGGELAGDQRSYERLGKAVETYLKVLFRYWKRYLEQGRDPTLVDQLFAEDAGGIAPVVSDLAPLLSLHPPGERRRLGLTVLPSERGVVHCIEEGRSLADKVFVEESRCDSVEELLHSRFFRVLYRRLLRQIHRDDPELAELSLPQLENQYGPLACLAAYRERQLIDDRFRRILTLLYRAWHSDSTTRVLAGRLATTNHAEKVAALHGISGKLNERINELMHAFEVPAQQITGTTSFDIGFERLEGIKAHPNLPPHVRTLIESCTFGGATAPLNPTPNYITGAAKRVADHRYGFLRRDGGGNHSAPPLDYFRQRLAYFAAHFDASQYLCNAVQVGPFRMLMAFHKSYAHQISDQIRLFPQIEAVQKLSEIDGRDWDGVFYFGLPRKVMGDAYKTGYIHDRKEDGRLLPVAWVAREDATDYMGFLKKSLLTLHNELTKALGGMPVHGSMITITFINGLRKTLVFSADSGTGKSETTTAMMEAMVTGSGLASELKRIDILAGDMLSLWRGEDGQLYAFGTETGDFLRLSDITESWKSHFGDLLNRGSYSNVDHPKNPRVTIPNLCEAEKVLSPTRVNCFFYINNYELARGSAVELSDDPHQVLKTTLVRGLRKNKGTSGDQPSLRASLEFAGRTDLFTRYRHSIDELLEWQERLVPLAPGPHHEIDPRAEQTGQREKTTCLAYRDGAKDVYQAREMVTAAFRGTRFELDGEPVHVVGVDYDLRRNLYWLETADRRRILLDRKAYDRVYEPLVSTFCGNPFVDPEGMDQTLGRFADTIRDARVHAGVIRTALAVPGYEFAGPEKAARDIIDFLREDEEVNARFQRNKDKVQRAMHHYYGGVLPVGTNLPVELEGYNLLLLEKYESTHVRFCDQAGGLLALETPFYRYHEPDSRLSESDPGAGGAIRAAFVPAILLPEMRAALADICSNPDYDLDPSEIDLSTAGFEGIRFWNDLDGLAFQVLLVSNVIQLGASEQELARFPGEVRKARYLAEHLAGSREQIPIAEADRTPLSIARQLPH